MTDDFDVPPTDDERMWALLDRYVAGDAQESELLIVRNWLAADASRAQIAEDLRRIREVARAASGHRAAGEAWRDLVARVHGGQSEARAGRAVHLLHAGAGRVEHRTSGSVRAVERRRWVWIGAAAGMLVAVGVAALLSTPLFSGSGSIFAQKSRVASRTFATARGRRAEVRLPDGTRVSLAPESRVTWRASGDSVARDVLLQGEAYFDVVHDPRRPFRVRALNAVIRDLGTRFAVRAYPLDSAVRVVVTQGQAYVRAATAPAASGSVLNAGMLAVINAAGTTSLRSGADTARYNAFARGQMQFVGAPLRTVVGEISRWYDVDVRLGDSTLGNRRITATLDDQTLPDLLAQLSITLNLRVVRNGNVVVFRRD